MSFSLQLEETTNRLACNASSRIGVLDDLSGGQLLLYRGGDAKIECALFNDTPSADSLVSDVSNIIAVDLYIRRHSPNGAVLVHKHLVGADVGPTTWANWIAEIDEHFTFQVTSTDTNQATPSNDELKIFFDISVSTATKTYVAAFGYGKIVDVGLTDIPAAIPPTYVGLYVNGAGQVQNPVVNFTGINVLGIDFTLVGGTVGSLTVAGTLTVDSTLSVLGQIANLEYIDVSRAPYNADMTGATNSAAALNSAIAAANASGKGIQIPDGTLSISSTITVTVPVYINAKRRADYNYLAPLPGGTTIKWIGAAGGTMMKFDNVFRVGSGLNNVLLDCNSLAANGLVLHNVTSGRWENISIVNFTTGHGLHLTATGVVSETTSWNTFINLILVSNLDGASCLYVSGDLSGTADSCLNSFVNTFIIHGGTRDAIRLGFSDNNTYLATYIYRSANGETPPGLPSTGAGVRVIPTEHVSFPSANIFTTISVGPGGWEQPAGTLSYAPVATIYGYQMDNGAPPPNVLGGSLFWNDNGGNIFANGFNGQSDVNIVGGGGNPLAIKVRNTNPAFASDLGLLASDGSTGLFARQYGNSASGSTAGLNNAGLGLVLFQNNTSALITTNNSAPLVLISGGVSISLNGGAATFKGTTAIRARVYNNADINIPNATVVALAFNSERFDSDSIHSTSSNTSRLTCNSAGTYAITGGVSFDINSTGYRFVSIRLNGFNILASTTIPATSGNYTNISVTTMYDLAATDYVELVVAQTSGGALNLRNDPSFSPEFMMVRNT